MNETWIEIDRWYNDRSDSFPECDVVGCGFNNVAEPENRQRRFFRLDGGPNDGLVLCEGCMEPADLLLVQL